MIYDKPCSIFLSSIRVGAKPKSETDLESYLDDEDRESYWDDEEREEVPDPDAQFRESMLGAVSNLGTSLGHIQIALWVLAIFFLLSLFV